jgi:hypothetical protein
MPQGEDAPPFLPALVEQRRRVSGTVGPMAETAGRSYDASDDKPARRAAREVIAAYHEQQLRALLEHVRSGFAQLDAGEIYVFTLDDLIHRYKRAAGKLWQFCGSTGGQWLHAANMLEFQRERGEQPDWWAASESRRSRPS